MPTPGNPLIIAHHLMGTLYGWWLPNDPRGSTSRTIRHDLLAELGQLHFGRREIQPASRDIRAFYDQACGALQHPRLSFAAADFPTVAQAIGDAVAECNYTCYACAVMPDHIHLIIRKHRDPAETMIDNLQSLTACGLARIALRPNNHPTWTRGGWKVFLDHPEEVQRTIHYVEQNPLKQRLPAQQWPWVTPYNNWPLHPGHSPNSPYAKALRRAGRYPR